jgi:hypothetical protein
VSSELLTADLSNFAQFGISSELLAAAGVRRVGDAEARDEFGIRLPASSDLSGLVFPYLDPRTLKRVTVRLRRDRPEIDTDGRLLNKYVSACGDRRHLYFAPGAIEFLGHTEIPVVLVEAEKSSLALTAWGKRNGHSFLAVGCGGCWGWRGRVGKVIAIDGSHVDEKGPLADLDLINWEDRDVVICFDSNAACNPNVRRARRDLAHELAARHASVRLANLPDEKGVNGPDDYLACLGDAAITELLDSARLFGEAAGAQLCQILQSLESGSASVMTPDAQQATLRCASNRLRRCNRVLWREIVYCHIVSNVFDLVVPDAHPPARGLRLGRAVRQYSFRGYEGHLLLGGAVHQYSFRGYEGHLLPDGIRSL